MFQTLKKTAYVILSSSTFHKEYIEFLKRSGRKHLNLFSWVKKQQTSRVVSEHFYSLIFSTFLPSHFQSPNNIISLLTSESEKNGRIHLKTHKIPCILAEVYQPHLAAIICKMWRKCTISTY